MRALCFRKGARLRVQRRVVQRVLSSSATARGAGVHTQQGVDRHKSCFTCWSQGSWENTTLFYVCTVNNFVKDCERFLYRCASQLWAKLVFEPHHTSRTPNRMDVNINPPESPE